MSKTRKITFKGTTANLSKKLNDGDLLEVSYPGATKIVLLKVDDTRHADCSRCALRENKHGCNFLVRPRFTAEPWNKCMPCDATLLGDDKEYKYAYCICYVDLDILENL